MAIYKGTMSVDGNGPYSNTAGGYQIGGADIAPLGVQSRFLILIRRIMYVRSLARCIRELRLQTGYRHGRATLRLL